MRMNIVMKRTVGVFVLAGAAFALAGPASAGTSVQNFNVTATVNAACTLTTTNLAFPNYVSGTALNDFSNTGFTVACPGVSAAQPAPVTLTFTSGSGVYAMVRGGSTLNYRLCQDAACTTLFAYGTAGTAVPVTTNPQTVTLFGEIPSGQAPPPGNYTQAVTATLTY